MVKKRFITAFNFSPEEFFEVPSSENLTEEGMVEDISFLVERFLRFGNSVSADDVFDVKGDFNSLEVPYDIFSDPDADLVDAWDLLRQASTEYQRILNRKKKDETPRKEQPSEESPSVDTSRPPDEVHSGPDERSLEGTE